MQRQITKKIGLIAYYGSGAYCDDLICEVTKKLLTKHSEEELEIDPYLMHKTAQGADVNFLNSFDLIIHCGGSLLGKCTHPPINSITKWVDKVTTPIAIFGPGYRYEPDKEPLNEESCRRLALLFEKAQFVTVRGKRTEHWLKSNGINISKIYSFGDPVMACDFEMDKIGGYILGNVRSMPKEEIQHSNTGDVHKLMAGIYDWLIEERKQSLLLTSFRHNIPSDNDVAGANATIRYMKHKNMVKIIMPKNYFEAFNTFHYADFCFAQRLHPSIFAAVKDIPFIGLEYQFEKMIDWCSTIRVHNYIHTKTGTLNNFKMKYYEIEETMIKLKNVLPIKIKEINESVKKMLEFL